MREKLRGVPRPKGTPHSELQVLSQQRNNIDREPNPRLDEIENHFKDLFVKMDVAFTPADRQALAKLQHDLDEILAQTEGSSGEYEDEKGQEVVNPKKRVICTLGLPGTGKSTQIKEIQKATNAPRYHLGEWYKGMQEAEGSGDAGNKERSAKGELVEGLDDNFLEMVAQSPDENIILDGFPRSVEQAEKLYEVAAAEHWDLQFVHLSFSQDQVMSSYMRQVSRSLIGSGEVDKKEIFGKIKRAIEQDVAAIKAVKATIQETAGSISDIDCARSPQEVTAEIQEKLGFDFESDAGGE